MFVPVKKTEGMAEFSKASKFSHNQKPSSIVIVNKCDYRVEVIPGQGGEQLVYNKGDAGSDSHPED
jgi:hypothetical protein